MDGEKVNTKNINDNVAEMPNLDEPQNEGRMEHGLKEGENIIYMTEGIAAYSEKRKLMYLAMLFMTVLTILVMVSVTNRGIYVLSDETLSFISQSFNAFVLLLIPFLLGSLGGFARVLMSGIRVLENTALILSSGLMAMFSWVGIKSGVLLSIVAPHLEEKGVTLPAETLSQSNFYTMALVAILVGMFSSNVYIFINQRVEQLAAQESSNNNKP